MREPAYQLPPAEGIPNGEVGAMDLEQLQKEKQDLEQQLLERNKVRVLFTSALYISALPCPCASVPSENFADAPWAPPGEILFH